MPSDDRYGVFARTRDLGVPLVLFGRNIDPPIDSWVGTDNVSISQTATEHLINAGRRRSRTYTARPIRHRLGASWDIGKRLKQPDSRCTKNTSAAAVKTTLSPNRR